jgi:CBS domain-containing protein
MSVKLLIKGKGSFVPVIRSERTLNDVINQLDLDNVGGLVVTDDNHEILGIITEHDIARGLKNHGRNVVDRPLRDLMTRDVITVDINEPLTRFWSSWTSIEYTISQSLNAGRYVGSSTCSTSSNTD